ncbi:AB-hydrolase YheT, partial [Fistulina hepatica ATCC 64428]
TEVHYAAKPALLTLRSGEHVSFKDFVESRCKSLYRPFRPDRWLLNGHLQTLYCVFGNFEKVNQVDYRRTFIRTREGGTIGLDWVHRPHTDSLPDDTPIVVVKHGLTGGSYEAYVRCILDPATRSRAEGGLGYRAVVCNFRGCAGVPITSSRLYSGEATDDLRYETMYIKYRYPNAPVLGLGFSLGGNVLTKYLGEEGSRSRIDAGCVLGCPWDFVANNITLNSTPLGTYGYSMGMGKNLQNIVGLHADSLTQIPPVPQGTDCLISYEEGARGGYHENAVAYYRNASSFRAVKDIRVPFLAINAADDPVDTRAAAENGWAALALTPHGGHLGWFEQRDGRHSGQPQRWVQRPLLEWLCAMGDEFVRKPSVQDSGPRRLYVDDAGWICE